MHVSKDSMEQSLKIKLCSTYVSMLLQLQIDVHTSYTETNCFSYTTNRMAGFSRPSETTKPNIWATMAHRRWTISSGSVSTAGSMYPQLSLSSPEMAKNSKKNWMSALSGQLMARPWSALSWRASRRTPPPRSPSWSTTSGAARTGGRRRGGARWSPRARAESAAPWTRIARRARPTPRARRAAAGRTGCPRCPRSRPSPAHSSPAAPCPGRCPARSGWSSCTTAPCRSRSPTRGRPGGSWRRRRSLSTSASSGSLRQQATPRQDQQQLTIHTHLFWNQKL